MLAIGIDIGGTSIKGAAVTTEGKVLEVFTLPVVKGEDQDVTINKLIDVVNNYIKEQGFKRDELLGIGLGVPGSVDTELGLIGYAGNLGWNKLEIVKMMESGTGLKVRITNDANAACLAEVKFGCARKYKNAIMFTLGTGLGGGAVCNGQLYEGNKGMGTEFGHALLELNGRYCTCGRRGCAEAYCSATALINDAKEAMEKDKSSKLWELAERNGKVEAKTVFDAIKLGDKAAQDSLDLYVSHLGETSLSFFNIFRPEVLILAGGVANAGDDLLKPLKEYVEVRHFGFPKTPRVEIVIAELGYDAGKIGAASLFF